MASLKPGDWVRFWTANWPDDVRSVRISLDKPGDSEDVTGQGLYMSRGRIVRLRENGAILVREERSRRLVEVSLGERIEPMQWEYHTLTLGDLRRFLEEHKEAPDDVPVNISLPVAFNCDDDGLDFEPGHPEQHDANSFESVSACNIMFLAFEENSSASAEEYIPPDEWEEGEEWHFCIDVIPNGQQAHDALRGEEHD